MLSYKEVKVKEFLTGKGTIRAGVGTMRASERTIRAG